jgi:hypothetical protein
MQPGLTITKNLKAELQEDLAWQKDILKKKNKDIAYRNQSPSTEETKDLPKIRTPRIPIEVEKLLVRYKKTNPDANTEVLKNWIKQAGFELSGTDILSILRRHGLLNTQTSQGVEASKTDTNNHFVRCKSCKRSFIWRSDSGKEGNSTPNLNKIPITQYEGEQAAAIRAKASYEGREVLSIQIRAHYVRCNVCGYMHLNDGSIRASTRPKSTPLINLMFNRTPEEQQRQASLLNAIIKQRSLQNEDPQKITSGKIYKPTFQTLNMLL